MNWSDHVVREFGLQIGIPELTLNQENRLHLDSDEGMGMGIGMINAGNLAIPEFIVYVSRPMSYFPADRFKSALKDCHYENFLNWPIQIGCTDKRMYFSMRIPQRSLSLSAVNDAFRTLKKNMSKHFNDSGLNSPP